MDAFTRLGNAIDQEYINGDLPENLLAPLRQVSQTPDQFADQIATVETLINQVKAFEPYCDCGCFAEGFNDKDLCKTLAELGINITT